MKLDGLEPVRTDYAVTRLTIATGLQVKGVIRVIAFWVP